MRVLLCALVAGALVLPEVAVGVTPEPDAPIALLHTEPRKAYELWVVNGDGSNAEVLVRGFGVFPVGWLPGGRRLLFQQERTYWIADVHTGTRVPQAWAGPLSAPAAISPDGARAAVLDADGGLSVSRLDGTAATQLVPAVGVIGNWSPDGTRIVYAKYAEIHTIGADGTGDQLIAGGYANASWSPDGTRLVASGAGPPPPPGTPVTGPIIYSRLALLAVDGSWQSPIPNTDNADGGAWSPDGSRIAFGRDGRTWVIAPDGSGLRPLGAPGLPGATAWSSGPRLARPVRTLPALPTVQVFQTSGQVRVKPFGADSFHKLSFAEYHRAGARLDARRGETGLSRLRSNGTIADTILRDGVFEIARVARRRLDIRLISAGRCSGSLRADAGFPLRVRGRRSTTTGRAAAWSVTERCNGSTVTTVHRGKVSVRDLRRKRTRTVRAGATYVAR